jgi:hypothetical protein
MDGWLLAHLAATWAMVGFAWTIQLVQYPQMALVPPAAFPAFEASHQRRVVAVLALLAPAEVVTAAVVALTVDDLSPALTVGSGALLAAIWVATGAWYAPIHGRLLAGFDPGLHRLLVRTNWIRTLAWSARGGLAVVMVVLADG